MNQICDERRRAWSRNALDALIAFLIAGGVLAVLLSTNRDYAMVFDEAFTVDREMTLAQWFAGVSDPPQGSRRADFFSRESLESYWRFSRKEPDGHPPFYALLGLAGYWLSRGWLDPLTSYRCGPMALTAATSGLIYLFLARRRGRLAGLTGGPRLGARAPDFRARPLRSLRHAGHVPLDPGTNRLSQESAIGPLDRRVRRPPGARGRHEVDRLVRGRSPNLLVGHA